MLIDREYLVEIDARDASGATVTLRFSRDGYMTARSDTPADTVYHPRISDPGTLALYLWGAGTTGGSSEVGWGSIILHNQDSGLDYLLTDGYGVAGVAVRIKIGAPTAALAAFETIFSGTIESMEFDADGTVRVALRDRQHLLSVAPLQDTLYAGSNTPPNGVEGLERDLRGKGKPRIYGGLCLNVAPPLVNASRLIYEISDRRCHSIEGLYEGGVQITKGVEFSRVQLTGDGSVPLTIQRTFSSGNVSAAGNTITLTGLVFNPGDRVTFSHATYNPFPSPLEVSSSNPFETRTYYARRGGDLVVLHNSSADALAAANTINLTTGGVAGMAFALSGGGVSWAFDSTMVVTANDWIDFGFSVSALPQASAVKISYPSSTAILPAPLKAQQSYYMGGSGSTFTLHNTQADAIAGANPIDLTTAGVSGLTFTATIFSSTTPTELSDWLDFAQSGVSTSQETITTTVAHGLVIGQAVKVRKKTTGTLPAPLLADTIYYARPSSSTATRLYPTRADAEADTNRVNLTSTGSSETNQISANTVAPGTYCWCNDDDGCFVRLGTKPVLAITSDAIGARTVQATPGTWVDFAQSGVSTGSDAITTAAVHGLTTGDPVLVRKKTVGTLPAPLAADTIYYARVLTTTVLELHATQRSSVNFGTRVDLTDQGSADLNQIAKATISYAAVATGSVLEQIALDAGLDAADIEAADVAALDAAAPAEVAEYLQVGDTRSARTVMDAVAASVGAWYAFDATGSLRMGRLVAPSGAPALTLTEDAIFEVQRTQAGGDGSGVPTWRCTLRYAPSYTVQTTEQLAGAVTDDRAAAVGREYREAVAEINEVLDVHPGAPTREFTARLVAAADAADEATRRQSLYGTRRDLLRVRVPLTAAVAAVELGSVVSITWPKLGLSAGRSTLLIGMETEWARDQAWLLLWG